MGLSEIPSVRLEDSGGVTFKYLVLVLQLDGQKISIVRGMNYQPYHPDFEEKIIGWTKQELDDVGFFDRGGDFVVKGGGSLTLNPYDETISIFGSNGPYGPEKNREAVAELVQSAFPTYKVFWFSPTQAPPPKAKRPAEKKPS